MSARRLRVFPYSEQEEPRRPDQEATVSLRLGDLIPILRRALQSNHVWLRDFHDDEIRVTQDFYDVIRAFTRLRPSA